MPLPLPLPCRLKHHFPDGLTTIYWLVVSTCVHPFEKYESQVGMTKFPIPGNIFFFQPTNQTSHYAPKNPLLIFAPNWQGPCVSLAWRRAPVGFRRVGLALALALDDGGLLSAAVPSPPEFLKKVPTKRMTKQNPTLAPWKPNVSALKNGICASGRRANVSCPVVLRS